MNFWQGFCSQDHQLFFKKEDKEVVFVGRKTVSLQYVLLAEKRQKSDVYNNRKYDDFKKWFSTAFESLIYIHIKTLLKTHFSRQIK